GKESRLMLSEGGQERPQPVENAGDQLLRRSAIMPALGLVPHLDGQPVLLRPVEEALYLRVDVELIATAVGGVHRQFALAEAGAVEQFDGVLAADFLDRRGTAPEQRADQRTQPDGEDAVEAADRLAAADVLAPAPAVRIEVGEVPAATVDPAQIQRRMDAEDHPDAIAIPHRHPKGCTTAAGVPAQDMRLALRSHGIVAEDEVPHVLHQKILKR